MSVHQRASPSMRRIRRTRDSRNPGMTKCVSEIVVPATAQALELFESGHFTGSVPTIALQSERRHHRSECACKPTLNSAEERTGRQRRGCASSSTTPQQQIGQLRQHVPVALHPAVPRRELLRPIVQHSPRARSRHSSTCSTSASARCGPIGRLKTLLQSCSDAGSDHPAAVAS